MKLVPIDENGFWGALVELGEYAELVPHLGQIQVETLNGLHFIRIDTLADDDKPGRCFLFPPSAVKFVTVSTEDKVRDHAKRFKPSTMSEAPHSQK